jgi:hypothetical protein
MQRGYSRRTMDAWRHTRHLANLLRNLNRGENDAATTDAQYLPLPGDDEYGRHLESTTIPERTPAEYAERDARLKAQFAYVATQPSTPV